MTIRGEYQISQKERKYLTQRKVWRKFRVEGSFMEAATPWQNNNEYHDSKRGRYITSSVDSSMFYVSAEYYDTFLMENYGDAIEEWKPEGAITLYKDKNLIASNLIDIMDASSWAEDNHTRTVLGVIK